MDRLPLKQVGLAAFRLLRRFVLRLVWVTFLATFGVHLCLTFLPPKRVVSPGQGFIQGPPKFHQWSHRDYFAWAESALTGELQISDQGTGAWERREFFSRVRQTLGLCLVAFALASALGVLLGTYAASIDFERLYGKTSRWARLWFDSGRWALYLSSSLPAYVIAYLLFLFYHSQSSLFMAVVSLAMGSGTGMDLARMAEQAHRRELASKYVESALGNGLKTGGLIPWPGHVSWHAFRNSLITLLPVSVMRLPLIMSSAIIVEVVFDLPGMGEALLHGLINQDVPQVLSLLLISVLFVQACLLGAELLVFALHPTGLSLES